MKTFTLSGATAVLADLEVHAGPFAVLGESLPARETRVRVKSAFGAAGFVPGDVQIVAPPGPYNDLAVAVAALGRDGADTAYVGELSLGGEVRAVRGLIPMLRAAVAAGIPKAVVPASQASEAALVPGIEVRVARTLSEALLSPERVVPGPLPRREVPSLDDLTPRLRGLGESLAPDVRAGKRILLTGRPGSGKTMLARRLVGCLPELGPEEQLDLATIASASGLPVATGRPFRAPHHTVSVAGLFGAQGRLGEFALAHGGVLFLDEIPEFSEAALEHLSAAIKGPYRPVVVGAMNPCPCGRAGTDRCRCKAEQIATYRARIPTGLFDEVVEVTP